MKNSDKYMKTILKTILVLTIFACAPEIYAAPPANDNFADAMPLILNEGTAGVTTVNIDAAKETGEPDHAENGGGKSVWFSFTPTATKIIRINTTNITFDTLLAVYTGDAVDNLQLVGYNNDCNTVCGGASTVDLMLNAGTTYTIAVDGLNDGGIVGEGSFKITLIEFDSLFQDNFSTAYNLGLSYKGGIAGTNYNATVEPDEPTAYTVANPNGKSVWYKWTSSDNFSVAFELAENFDSQIGIYTSNSGSPTFAQLTKIASNIDYTGYTSARYRTTFFAEANRTYYIKIDWHTFNNSQAPVGNFQLKYFPNNFTYSARFSGFGQKTSIGVFRPSEANWYLLTNLDQPNPFIRHWGLSGDTPIVADFNGDGVSERAAVRNENGQKIWYIDKGGATIQAIQWGLASDKPVTGDFDRDGRADLAVIRNSASGYIWYIRRSRDGAMQTFVFGTTGDKPVFGDFDGDGFTEIAVVRNTQSGLIWYFLKSGFETGQTYDQFEALQFGVSPDIPAVEDFDGDGKTDIAVFRPSTGVWYIRQSQSGQMRIDAFGLNGDKPQPADYNGDGKADLAVFRPSDGTWYIAKPSGIPAQNFHTIKWGLATDIPVSSMALLSE